MTEPGSSGSPESPRQSSAARQMGIRVATYNVRGLRDDGASAARIVRAIDPDILLLQEVPRYPTSARRIAAFARWCGLRWDGRTRAASGTTLMTTRSASVAGRVDRRFPALDANRPWRDRAGSGILDLHGWSGALVTIGGRGAPVLAISMHLGLDGDHRIRQVESLMHAVEQMTVDRPDAAVVLGGDLNGDQNDPAWQLLSSALPVVSDSQPTFPSAVPRRRIDAVFASPSLVRGCGQAGEAGLNQAGEVETDRLMAAASDHRPVWVDLEAP